MPTKGRLESRITVPSGGWSVDIDEGGGAVTITVPAGDYYHSSADSGSRDLLAEFQKQCNDSGSLANTYSFSIAAGEGQSGKVTLSADGSFSVTWSSTDLRDVLGFESDGDLASASSHTSSEAARSVWISDSTYQTLNGGDSSWQGWQISNLRAMVNDAGYFYALGGQKRTETQITWPAVSRERTWKANETVTNQSFEKFWEDGILGEANWSSRPGGPVRWYQDADVDGTHVTYNVVLPQFRPDALRQHWTGAWQIVIPRAIVDPG